jgi:hypothetical protein
MQGVVWYSCSLLMIIIWGLHVSIPSIQRCCFGLGMGSRDRAHNLWQLIKVYLWESRQMQALCVKE